MQSVRFVHRFAALASLAALRFAIYVWQPQRRLVVGVVAVAAFLVGGSLLFRATVRDNLEATGRYRLLEENVAITSPPEWVRSDVVADAFARGGLTEMSLLDERLTEHVAHAFALCPWVREVVSVRKLPVGRVQVELAYRQPAAMVEVTLADGTGGLIFIDDEGIILPTDDFRPEDASKYLRISAGAARVPTAQPGTRWGDDTIERSAALAAVLRPKRDPWSFYRLIAPTQPGEPAKIVSRNGAQIVWGALPGAGSGGEAAFDTKVERIAAWTDNRGLSGADKSLVLDVRAKEGTP
jgi:hypothetical protein